MVSCAGELEALCSTTRNGVMTETSAEENTELLAGDGPHAVVICETLDGLGLDTRSDVVSQDRYRQSVRVVNWRHGRRSRVLSLPDHIGRSQSL